MPVSPPAHRSSGSEVTGSDLICEYILRMSDAAATIAHVRGAEHVARRLALKNNSTSTIREFLTHPGTIVGCRLHEITQQIPQFEPSSSAGAAGAAAV